MGNQKLTSAWPRPSPSIGFRKSRFGQSRCARSIRMKSSSQYLRRKASASTSLPTCLGFDNSALLFFRPSPKRGPIKSLTWTKNSHFSSFGGAPLSSLLAPLPPPAPRRSDPQRQRRARRQGRGEVHGLGAVTHLASLENGGCVTL